MGRNREIDFDVGLPMDINPQWLKRVRPCVYYKTFTRETYDLSDAGGEAKWEPADEKLEDCGKQNCIGSDNYIKYPEENTPLVEDRLR